MTAEEEVRLVNREQMIDEAVRRVKGDARWRLEADYIISFPCPRPGMVVPDEVRREFARIVRERRCTYTRDGDCPYCQ